MKNKYAAKDNKTWILKKYLNQYYYDAASNTTTKTIVVY